MREEDAHYVNSILMRNTVLTKERVFLFDSERDLTRIRMTVTFINRGILFEIIKQTGNTGRR